MIRLKGIEKKKPPDQLVDGFGASDDDLNSYVEDTALKRACLPIPAHSRFQRCLLYHRDLKVKHFLRFCTKYLCTQNDKKLHRHQ